MSRQLGDRSGKLWIASTKVIIISWTSFMNNVNISCMTETRPEVFRLIDRKPDLPSRSYDCI